jgi:hypothetical protein
VAERIDKLENHFPQDTLLAQDRFEEIMRRHYDDAFTWSKSCLLYFVGQTQSQSHLDTVQKSLSHAEPIVRETAL